jgi:transcriptional regulator with XRE-family HTH domain
MRTYWREANIDLDLSIDSTGAQLKHFRTKANMSQRDVAERLGYVNINFMCMIEKDRTGIPANRFFDFMEAYEVPNDTRLELYASCYSVHWGVLKQLLISILN